MSDVPKTVKIKEVGPREGFQFEKGAISLADKISLVDALSDTGLRTIEFQHVPGSRFERVEAAGHSTYFERPEVFNREVGAFLKAHRP